MISAKHAHLFFVVAILFPSLVNSTPNSVCNDPGYALLRPCAAYCVGCDPRPDQIAYEIGCGPVPPNECWCRVDLFALATSALSSCVSKSCTIGGWAGDYSSAQRFYTSYCQKAGFTAVVNGPANSNALTTAVQSAPPGTGGGYTSAGPTQTSTSQATSTGAGGRGGLSSSDIIALGVGIGIGIPATIAALVTCCLQIRRH